MAGGHCPHRSVEPYTFGTSGLHPGLDPALPRSPRHLPRRRHLPSFGPNFIHLYATLAPHLGVAVNIQQAARGD